MSGVSSLAEATLLLGLLIPVALLAILALSSVFARRLSEAAVSRLTGGALLASTIAFAFTLALYLLEDMEPTLWTGASWFSSGHGQLQFDILIDAWSLGFALLTATIGGVICAFSARYLHADSGFYRYFTLSACFIVGMLLISLAGSIEVLFAGWELVGLSSALLVAFFHERKEPVRNAMRVFATYRLGDAAMAIAAILIHHAVGSGSLSTMFRTGSPDVLFSLSGAEATAIGVCFLAAVAAKSALLPLSGWLPRAMEGPTPSSAVFYGSLSVHAGCYLLWRAWPLLDHSLTVQILALAAGATTAVFAGLVTRVQTDVKSALSYATLTQIGLIVVEISLGLRLVPFLHMIGHACYRLLQFLSAPNLLHDLHSLETVAAASRVRKKDDDDRRERGESLLYLICLERGFLDPLLDRFLVAPIRRLLLLASRVDRALAGDRSSSSSSSPSQEESRCPSP
jgi:NAD(P)H-quinone oxidoreductase subunit 5